MLTNPKQYSLSIIVITLNEEDRIGRCLASVKPIADEIIVLDSGSSDKTIEISKSYGAQVFETDWPGYGVQKQRALEKATCQWVLSIDADEELTVDLVDEINSCLSHPQDIIGFKLKWGVTTFGRTLKYGRSSRAPLRLFQREGARFTNDIVHEKVILPEGKIKTLKGLLLHYTHRDFEHYLEKNRKYAWLGAQKRFDAGKKVGLFGGSLRALWTFVQIYFLQRGFLDGKVGFLVAVMYTQGCFNKYAGLWALRHEAMVKQGKE